MKMIVTGGAGFIGANFVYYELNTSVLQELILWVEQFGGRKS